VKNRAVSTHLRAPRRPASRCAGSARCGQR